MVGTAQKGEFSIRETSTFHISRSLSTRQQHDASNVSMVMEFSSVFTFENKTEQAVQSRGCTSSQNVMLSNSLSNSIKRILRKYYYISVEGNLCFYGKKL